MRPQYCGCGPQRNRIGPQLRCDRKSHATPQRIRNATPQQTAIVNSVTNQGKSIKKKLKKYRTGNLTVKEKQKKGNRILPLCLFMSKQNNDHKLKNSNKNNAKAFLYEEQQ
jgi:predicted phage gp36 major capsid-like protein